MTFAEVAVLAKQLGFTACVPLDVSTITLKPEVRDMCVANTCGQYGKRWSCPPGCGSLEECRRILQNYTNGILVQTCGEIEDGFDFEKMMEIESTHKDAVSEMYVQLKKKSTDILVLGSGCCTQCKICTYPNEPCRFPEKMISSMEAYGMLVLEICKSNGLQYYYGPEKIAYTSCFLFC